VTSRPLALDHTHRTAVQLPLWVSFLAASLSFVAVFAASASPIPLYDIYHRTSGVTKTDLSLTAVAYFVAAVTALLVLGRLSKGLCRPRCAHRLPALTPRVGRSSNASDNSRSRRRLVASWRSHSSTDFGSARRTKSTGPVSRTLFA
jgi:hypothetical protein